MRLDDFAATADGSISAQDRTRFLSVGFDLAPTAIILDPVVGHPKAKFLKGALGHPGDGAIWPGR